MVSKAFTAALAGLTACPRTVPEPRQLPVEPGPRSVGLKRPAEAIFGRPDETGRWLRLRKVRPEEGNVFGWRIRLPCRQPVEYLEIMKLPSAGDFAWKPGELRETTISDDRRTATTRDYAACIEGWIEHTWAASVGDPKGPWEITVAIAGYQTQVFRATFE